MHDTCGTFERNEERNEGRGREENGTRGRGINRGAK